MLILRKFLRDLPALTGLVIVLAVVVVAAIGPWLAPYPQDAAASHLLQRLKPPSAAFPVCPPGRRRRARPVVEHRPRP
jgi:peptide/nickel transport system permease protein